MNFWFVVSFVSVGRAQSQVKVMEMEEEAEKLKALTEGVDGDDGEDAGEVDKRSIYVGNVDYGSSPEELQEHFKVAEHTQPIAL